ncbi:AsmA family protein [Variovorax terrae]|uniref:AsmA family protein n=1 Tax=Variovorax terrae TaxID=2923278 RepID=A0A9X1W0M3_9BURK|nr:AsmA family protein [Variovorax terrae]MCJ0765629.1 AsmA family protein [Variovorax terrae]
MSRIFKWLAASLLLAAALLGAAAFALHLWLGSGDFRLRLAREASAALGVQVLLDGVYVTVWPLPAVAFDGVRVQSQPAVTLQRVEIRPAWGALLQGRLEVATLVLHEAVLPQQGLAAILGMLQKKKHTTTAGPGPEADEAEKSSASITRWLPRRTVLDGVTWQGAGGRRSTVSGEARLGPDGLPDTASLNVVAGAWQGAQATLQRQAPGWQLKVAVGGGTVEGSLQWLPAPGGVLALQGRLETRGVEVAALTAPSRPLSGRLEASTTFSARAANPGALADALQTQTRFTVQGAVLHGLDLAKAVTTVGLSRGGETRLDTLTGQVNTQGRAAQLSQLVARSGVLTASGSVAVSPARALSGRISVDAAGGIVGVPLAVGGTLEAPEVTLTRGAMLGAAIGTAVMPGVGTGAGARLGDKISNGVGKLFGK